MKKTLALIKKCYVDTGLYKLPWHYNKEVLPFEFESLFKKWKKLLRIVQ